MQPTISLGSNIDLGPIMGVCWWNNLGKLILEGTVRVLEAVLARDLSMN